MKKIVLSLALILAATPLLALDIYEPLAKDALWMTTKGTAPFASNPTTILFGEMDYAINNSVLIGALGQADYNNGIVNKVVGISGIANVSNLADQHTMVDVLGSLRFSSTQTWTYNAALQARGLLEGGFTPYGILGFNQSTAAGSQVAFDATTGASYLLTEQIELLGNLDLDFGGANVSTPLNLIAGTNFLLSDLLEFQVDMTLPLANAGNTTLVSFALYAGL